MPDSIISVVHHVWGGLLVSLSARGTVYTEFFSLRTYSISVIRRT